jgi:hypothetical protein
VGQIVLDISQDVRQLQRDAEVERVVANATPRLSA